MDEFFRDFFTLTGMITFFLGVGTAVVWHMVKQRYIGEREPINYRTLGIICGVAALVFIGMQNTQLSAEVKRCQQEFNDRLRTRAAITDEDGRLSREHRFWLGKRDDAISDLIKWTWMPGDPTVAALDINDPRRQAYTSALVVQYNLRIQNYDAEIDRIVEEQAEVVANRKAHPLPTPTCGETR